MGNLIHNQAKEGGRLNFLTGLESLPTLVWYTNELTTSGLINTHTIIGSSDFEVKIYH